MTCFFDSWEIRLSKVLSDRTRLLYGRPLLAKVLYKKPACPFVVFQ